MRKLLGFAVVCFIAVCLFYWVRDTRQPAEHISRPWQSLHKGMTPAEVEALLGKPHLVEVVNAQVVCWAYFAPTKASRVESCALVEFHTPSSTTIDGVYYPADLRVVRWRPHGQSAWVEPK